MLANKVVDNKISEFEILQDPQNASLLQVLKDFAKILSRYNIKVLVYSKESLNRLSQIPSEQKLKIENHFRNWAGWLQQDGEIGPMPIEDVEKLCLQKALDYYGLEIDQEFWKTLKRDQIIELYGDDMVQLYRSLNFFNLTGYSLLDISIFEWYVLWQRSSKAIEATMGDLEETIEQYVPVKKFNIPQQIIKEIYNTEMNHEDFVPRILLADFIHCGTLTSKNDLTLEPKGFICTSTGKVVSIGEETSNIQFI